MVDQVGFARLWARMEGELARRIRRLVPRDLVADVLQETALDLWQRADGTSPDQLERLARRVAGHRAIDARRALRRRLDRVLPAFRLDECADHKGREGKGREELLDLLLRADLTKTERAVLDAVCCGVRTMSEAAERIGVSRARVRQILSSLAAKARAVLNSRATSNPSEPFHPFG